MMATQICETDAMPVTLMYNYDTLCNNGSWECMQVLNTHHKHKGSVKSVCFIWPLMNHWISETNHWSLLGDM